MAERTIATTPLGDELLFARLTGRDRISAGFAFEVELHSETYDIAANDLLGREITVTHERGDRKVHLSGLCTDFRYRGGAQGYAAYVATLRPWTWFLGLRRDCRIFQQMSTVEIVEQVLGAHPGAEFELRLQGSYPIREYCVQYDESDLAFVSRLLEHEGIWYFFEFEEGAHRMVLTDALADTRPVHGLERVAYYGDEGRPGAGENWLWAFSSTGRAVTGAFSHDDYDFTKPSADLAARADGPFGYEHDAKEDYANPGAHDTVARGDALAAIRLEALQAAYRSAQAEGVLHGIHCGARLEVTNLPRDADSTAYMVSAVEYAIDDPQRVSGTTGRRRLAYEARVDLHPADHPFRPALATPRPAMRGPQTAVVTGPAGEEIYCDEYSRVKVQFHWDRLGGKDENTSCFVRVSSAWAGAGWGFIQIPRIGQEVIVDFIEGDPDRPIITGRVYNAEQMPPYGLPGNMTRSGWKSNSTPGGGGWNELRFEDKAGSEEVYFQAEKDHTELIKNDEARSIGHDFLEDVGNNATQNIGVDRTETVGSNKTVTVGKNQITDIGIDDTETVGSNRTLTVGVDETISIGSNATETIGTNHTQSVGAIQTITVGAARVDTVGGAETRTVALAQAQTVGAARNVAVGAVQSHEIGASDNWTIGAGQSVNIGATQSVSVGGTRTVSIGGDDSESVGGGATRTVGKACASDIGTDMTVKAGKTIVLEAGDQIVLRCGKASILLKKDGTIVIDGKDLTLNASGKIDQKAGSDITMKGSKIKQN